ncbi:MAG: hypothetical protein Q9226_005138 [Calogaya cf. arnoldii]
MLGRLEMDIDECISCYTELMRKVFATRKSLIPMTWWGGKTEGRFDSSNLRTAVEEVITKRGLSKQEPLDDGKDRGCRVFVCTTASETTGITRLRSYTLREEMDIPSTICEAALATSATTRFFKPVHIGARKFVDGALKANNPASEVEEEASSIWYSDTLDLKSQVKCFVSVGTGHPGKKPIEDNAANFFSRTLVDIATETESTAERFINLWRQQHEKGRYFRFNVHQGLQGVGLEEHAKQGTIEATTYEYMRHTEQKSRVRDCVQNLKTKQNKAKANFAADVDMLTSLDLYSKTAHVHWTVYRSRNPLFTGRDDILRDLEAAIRDAVKDSSDPDQRTIAISGMGGQGKSEICLQLAYRVRQIFWGVFWVDVSAKSTAKNDFLTIAKKLGIETESMEEAQQGLANAKESCLLVLDNADDPDVDYQRYFPAGVLGVVLLTSRNAECRQYASSPELAVELEGLPESDARELLLHATNTPREQWRKSEADAQTVTTLLRSHPLALIQAGAYISRAHCTIAEYPRVFNSQRERLLKFRPRQAKSRYGDVYATFEASASFLQSSQGAAAKDALQLLSMLGVCAARRLPLQLLFEEGWKLAQSILLFEDLRKLAQSISSGNSNDGDTFLTLTPWHVSHLPSLLQADADAWDPFRLVEAVGLLKAFSLVSADTNDDLLSVSMHPLTNAWALDRLDAAAQHKAWLATGCLFAVRLFDTDMTWVKPERQLQPHLRALLSLDMNIMFASEPPTPVATLITQCGLLLCVMRDVAKVKDLMANLMVYLNLDPLTVDARWLPIYYVTAVNHLHNYGLQKAVSLLEQVAQILNQQLAEDHPISTFLQYDLALAYMVLSEGEKAITLLEQVGQIWKQEIGEDDPIVLNSQCELARAYMVNGETEKAIALLEQVVQIWEQTACKDHPGRLISQQVLASMYRMNGQVERAVSPLEQVVQIWEDILAEDHPARLQSQYELARAYQDDGQDKKAMSVLKQVVRIREQTQAEDNPERLASQHVLATIFWDLGPREDAVQLMKHVVKVKRKAYGDEPDAKGSAEWLRFFEDEMSETKATENGGGSELSDSSASHEGGVESRPPLFRLPSFRPSSYHFLINGVVNALNLDYFPSARPLLPLTRFDLPTTRAAKSSLPQWWQRVRVNIWENIGWNTRSREEVD